MSTSLPPPLTRPSFYRQFILSMVLCAGVLIGLGASTQAAQAFWVDELRLNSENAHYEDFPGTIKNDGKDSQVFLNEVDPTHHIDHWLWFTPSKAKYEIAAPNGTDLTGWTFSVYESEKKVRSRMWFLESYYSGTLVKTYELKDVLPGGPVFKDQQQGWGFKSFEGVSPTGTWTDFSSYADVRTSYVLANPQGKVVQALSYRHESILVDGPAKDITTTSIKGLSHHFRKGMRRNQPGSWKFNNVFMEPDSTYGSLQIVEGNGSKHNPYGYNKRVQWYNPLSRRVNLTPTLHEAFPDRWDMINFSPQDVPTNCIWGVRWIYKLQWGSKYCTPVGDTGYFFDVWKGVDNDIPPIEDRTLKTHEPFTLRVTSNPVAMRNVQFDPALPDGLTYSKQTGMITGALKQTFDTKRFVLSAYNPDFISNGYNGHGITYRTFFWNGVPGKAPANTPPVIAMDDIQVEVGRDSRPVTGTVTDHDGDAITRTWATYKGSETLPKGFTFTGTDPVHPVLQVNKTAAEAAYEIVVHAKDARGGIGTKTVRVNVGKPRSLTISAADIIKDYGETVSRKLTVHEPDNARVKFDLVPIKSAVPAYAVLDPRPDGVYLVSHAMMPVNTWVVRVKGTSPNYVGYKDITITVKDKGGRPQVMTEPMWAVPLNTSYSKPVSVSSIYPVNVRIVGKPDCGVPFSITTKQHGGYLLTMPPVTSPKACHVTVRAESQADTSQYSEQIVHVYIEGTGTGPIITTTTLSYNKANPPKHGLELEGTDPAGGHITFALRDATSVPNWISVRNGRVFINGESAPIGAHKVPVTATNDKNQRTTKIVSIVIS